MAGYRIISSDDHVFEPKELWTSRVEPRYRNRAPHIVRHDDGAIGGTVPFLIASCSGKSAGCITTGLQSSAALVPSVSQE